MFVLIVTWLAINQPPSTTYEYFPSQAGCEAALGEIHARQEAMRGQIERLQDDAIRHAVGFRRPLIPQIIAVCAQRG
jgi:hypothetical protein